MRIDLDVVGVPVAVAELLQARDRADASRDVLRDVRDDMLATFRRQYARGDGWQALSAEQALRKAHQGRSTVPLAGGPLEESLTTDGGGLFGVRDLTDDEVVVATRDPAAGFQTDRHGRRPARDPMPVSSADEQRWADIVARGLLGGPVTGRLGL